jgi:pyruvate dehydrogenase E2 component (dihydrolipoamide acetyltransferase)
MRVEVVVPQIGEAVSELELVQWLKEEGDWVEEGEPLFEVDSDKAIVEVQAFASGRLAEIIAPAGSAVTPQQVVAIITPVGETEGQKPEKPAAASSDGQVNASPVARRVAAELGVDLAAVSTTTPGARITADDVRRAAGDGELPTLPERKEKRRERERILASPKARARANELGVSLDRLTGSGPDGMITTGDVEEAVQEKPPELSSPEKSPGKRRRVVAERMVRSKQEVPHFYLMADVDMSQVDALRAYCQQTLSWERPPTYTDVIVRACALALSRLPQFNVSYKEGRVVQHDGVNIGVAAGLPEGLLVPVVAAADELSLARLSGQMRQLIGRARKGRLHTGDVGQRSMVISNLGMHGVDAFVAIIDIPNPMILAVGRVSERVVPVAGQPVIRPMCTLTLSVDHRVFDGVEGAQFLERIKLLLEQPFELL